jgi:potassium uptake TrkH family protein
MRWHILKLRVADQWYFLKRNLPSKINRWLLFFSTLSLLLVIYDFGFHQEPSWQRFVNSAYGIIFLVFFLLFTIRFAFDLLIKRSWGLLLSEFIILLLLLLATDLHFVHDYRLIVFERWTDFFSSKFFNHSLLIIIFGIELSRSSLSLLRMRFNPSLLYLGSFFFLIVFGTGLLLLPRATHEGISFTDALFTSASAVCVTGLIVVDTATFFTPLGQGIILFLIQLGGLGVMVFTSFFGFFFQGSHSFQNQIFLKDFINEEQLGKIFRTLIKILGFTFGLEIAGALLIYQTFPADLHSGLEKVWYSVFHSVSAFCNAGFSVFSDGLFDAGMGARHNFNMHMVIAWLIVLGGLGFPVVINFYTFLKYFSINKWHQLTRREEFHHIPRVINANSRIVLVTTFCLLVGGTLGFWFFERDGVLSGLGWYGQLVTAFFGAVTPRTAGFNTIDMTTIAVPTILFYLFLMWVGASPSSTGGGVKTSTFALAILNIWSIARGRNRLEIFGRQVTNSSTNRAFGIIIMSILVIGLCTFSLAYTNPALPLRALVFESFSAFSTVGLSLGITSQINDAGKLILTAAMFIGRIGTLTILVAFFRKLSSWSYRFPSEQIYIN